MIHVLEANSQSQVGEMDLFKVSHPGTWKDMAKGHGTRWKIFPILVEAFGKQGQDFGWGARK